MLISSRRKTGIELPDTGIRDEDGMEPLEHLFSSPERPSAPAPEPGDETIDEEMDMEIESRMQQDPKCEPSLPGNLSNIQLHSRRRPCPF